MRIETATPSMLQERLAQLEARYQALCSENLALNLTRGKPSPEQLALSDALDGILKGDYQQDGKVDIRNYGGLDGLEAAKRLFAPMLDLNPDEIMVGGNSSLNLMHQCLTFAQHFGFEGPQSAWRNRHERVRVLCPVPGYDRHFKVCSHLGMEMVPIPMTEEGPDMDELRQHLRSDPSICAMWNVPRFSNPTGVVYSDAVVDEIAQLPKIAGPDFRILWDNAYAVHTLQSDAPKLASIMKRCQHHQTQDSLLIFGSTSKVTFAGAGVALLGASPKTLSSIKQHLAYCMIGPDKINQARHIAFFGDFSGILAHMEKHAELLRPRFDAVLSRLSSAFGDSDLGSWSIPQGGYFISFDSRPGLAKQVVELAAKAGVALTPAGATFPGGHDPEDRNIRIAPTFPSVDAVGQATDVLCTCVELASIRQALAS